MAASSVPLGYWGTKAIAERMGVSREGLYALHRIDGFLMFRRRRPRAGRGKSPLVWFTDEGLIRQWQLARCKVDHADALARSLAGKRSDVSRPVTVSAGDPA